MPAESHSQRDRLGSCEVLALVAEILDVDPTSASGLGLAAVELDDEIAVLHLWKAVAEEFAERSVGAFEPPEPLPSTLGELVDTFLEALPSRKER